MKKVLIQLSGDPTDIKLLQGELISSEWSITNQENVYYLSTDKFDENASNENIMKDAEEFIEVLNGIGSVMDSDYKALSLGHLNRALKSGKREIVVSPGCAVVNIRGFRPILEIANQKSNLSEATETDTWVLKALKDPNVKDAVVFFKENSWVGLYKTYDIICSDVGGKKNLVKLISKNELSRFTHTANSRAAIGKAARHGYIGPKPKDPMTFIEARSFIKLLMEKWAKTKP